MILRDFACTQCGTVVADVWCDRASDLTCFLLCDECRDMVEHIAVANGGMRCRYRLNDFPTDPAFYRGQVTALPPTATNVETGEPVEMLSGGLAQETPKFHNDRREDRRDRFRFGRDKQRGRRPIYSLGDAKKVSN